MRLNEQQKANLIQEANDEINMLRNGITCSPKHVKRYCRNRSMYLAWVISRLEKNMSIENVPRTMYAPPRVI